MFRFQELERPNTWRENPYVTENCMQNTVCAPKKKALHLYRWSALLGSALALR